MSKAVMANPRLEHRKKISTLRANIIYQQDFYCTNDRTFVDNTFFKKITQKRSNRVGVSLEFLAYFQYAILRALSVRLSVRRLHYYFPWG